jgi:hypothetical protein
MLLDDLLMSPHWSDRMLRHSIVTSCLVLGYLLVIT